MSHNYLGAIALVAIVATATLANAQESDDDAVRMHVEQLFEAMRASDADAVRAHFHPEFGRLYAVYRDEHNEVAVQVMEADDFATRIGSAPVGQLDERSGPVEVRIDGDLATAFMPYAFYVGDRYSHCGVNAFHLIRTPDGWRTAQITYTRRAEDCHPSIAPSID